MVWLLRALTLERIRAARLHYAGNNSPRISIRKSESYSNLTLDSLERLHSHQLSDLGAAVAKGRSDTGDLTSSLVVRRTTFTFAASAADDRTSVTQGTRGRDGVIAPAYSA